MRRLAPLLVGILALGACAPDSSNATPVGVELSDGQIALQPSEAAAGLVTFEVENRSSGLTHEIEVFSGGVDGVVLPVVNSVADTTGLVLVDEVEDIVPGASASLTLDLEPGTYLVMCNLPGHYELGMWAYLEVGGN